MVTIITKILRMAKMSVTMHPDPTAHEATNDLERPAAPWKRRIDSDPKGEQVAENEPIAYVRTARQGSDASTNRSSRKGRQSKRLFLIFAGALGLAGASWWGWATFVASDTESTDNAYTNVEVSQVMPLVGGPVKRVLVVNSQRVQAGDVLFELDDTDLQLAVDQAEAALGLARRKVRQIDANDENLAAQEQARIADEGTARADFGRANADLDKSLRDQERAQKLSVGGWVSGAKLDDTGTVVQQARAAVAQAEAGIEAAKAAKAAAIGARRANHVLVENATVETNPEVMAAKAKLSQTKVDLARAVIRAPVDGIIDQRNVAVGQRVQAGNAVMVVVPLKEMYVDANFKEVQLGRVRAGQPVRVTSDLYGSDEVYHGRVVGFGGGTGSAFAVIPAQNATGNWIKVVQRLPVRIQLDPAELRAHPLRVGLSMHAVIDISGAH
jgi:membrane fusion protein (multidrug efflux system)